MTENLCALVDIEWWGIWNPDPGTNGKAGGWIRTMDGRYYWGPRVVIEAYAREFKESWPQSFARRFGDEVEKPAPQHVPDPQPIDDNRSRFQW